MWFLSKGIAYRVILLLLLAVSFGLWVRAEYDRNQPNNLNSVVQEGDEVDKRELRLVRFCDDIYRAEKILIEGVDIVERIGELLAKSRRNEGSLTSQRAERICENIERHMPSKNVYAPDSVPEELPLSELTSFKNHLGHKTYTILITNTGFQIDAVTQEVFLISAIGDVPLKVGMLK